MDQQSTAAGAANGASTPHDLFVLTDEQILEIEPEGEVNVAPPFRAASSPAGPPDVAENAGLKPGATQNSQDSQTASQQPPVTSDDSAGPPPWLAVQMKDPWNGEAAKELWNGVQQAKQEAAAYRAAFATPEDALALKELYPGGVDEARAAANRARLLDQIDGAYFGAAGSTAEQTSVARAQLAQMMIREDPAAFREMVFAGLRALEEAEKGSGPSTSASNLPRLAQVFAASRIAAPETRNPKSEIRNSSRSVEQLPQESASNFDSRASSDERESPVTSHQSLISGYAAFEKAANEDLERSVGAAISRTIEQALPNVTHAANASAVGAQHAAPLQARLTTAIRQDVEAALKGDRQLGEQIAQILSARRFDNETRAQVVRLIGERAQQLVPVAAKRVLNDWTQTTLAAHRSNATRADVASTRREVEPAVAQGTSPAAFSSRGAEKNRGAMARATPDVRRVDYRKLSDEQILDL